MKFGQIWNSKLKNTTVYSHYSKYGAPKKYMPMPIPTPTPTPTPTPIPIPIPIPTPLWAYWCYKVVVVYDLIVVLVHEKSVPFLSRHSVSVCLRMHCHMCLDQKNTTGMG